MLYSFDSKGNWGENMAFPERVFGCVGVHGACFTPLDNFTSCMFGEVLGMFGLERIIVATGVAALLALGGGLVNDARASTVTLDSSMQCSEGNANPIAVTDVTGDLGGATDCWGAFDKSVNNGNDPANGGFQIGDDYFGFAAKINFEESGKELSGANIGLDADETSTGVGTWSFAQGAMSGDPFLLVLKQASNPGFAVWLFDGDDAASYSGNWLVAWEPKGISHISIYGNPSPIPLPAGGLLLITALGGLGIAARRRRKSA